MSVPSASQALLQPCLSPAPGVGERGALVRALLAPDLHAALTPRAILTAAADDLFQHLPLVLAAVQRVAEMPCQRRMFSLLHPRLHHPSSQECAVPGSDIATLRVFSVFAV
jgi:hypothetical protein